MNLISFPTDPVVHINPAQVECFMPVETSEETLIIFDSFSLRVPEPIDTVWAKLNSHGSFVRLEGADSTFYLNRDHIKYVVTKDDTLRIQCATEGHWTATNPLGDITLGDPLWTE